MTPPPDRRTRTVVALGYDLAAAALLLAAAAVVTLILAWRYR